MRVLLRFQRGSSSFSAIVEKGEPMRFILLVILVLLLLGALPTWPYSAGWGYAPGGVLGTALVVVVILMLLGRL